MYGPKQNHAALWNDQSGTSSVEYVLQLPSGVSGIMAAAETLRGGGAASRVRSVSPHSTIGFPGSWPPHGMIATAEIEFFGEPSISLSL